MDIQRNDMNKYNQWFGHGGFRLIIEVQFREGIRDRETCPAEVYIDFQELLKKNKLIGFVQLSTFQLIQFDDQTGEPLLPKRSLAGGHSQFDIPFRFDRSDERGDGFKSYLGSDTTKGTLVWVHTARTKVVSSYYALYFDIGPELPEPDLLTPRAWIGDCDALYRYDKGSLYWHHHGFPAIADLNGDGIPDLAIGHLRGKIESYTGIEPLKGNFSTPHLLTLSDGKPLDVGWHCQPCWADWDGDGDLDLLVGMYGGRIKYYENVGSRYKIELVDKGILHDMYGAPIHVPCIPCPEAPHMELKFKELWDYTIAPEAVDFDGDGMLDLVAGGYLSGRILWWKRMPGGGLKPMGEILADGKPIDKGWIAIPSFGDLDGDGDLDLVVTSYVFGSVGGAKSCPALYYFENIGTRTEPIYTEHPFPFETPWDKSAFDVVQGKLADINGDGLLDYVWTTTGELGVLENVGTRNKPLFRPHKPFERNWVMQTLGYFSSPPVDIDGDGTMSVIKAGLHQCELMHNGAKHLNPPQLVSQGILKSDGKEIVHLYPWGDAHTFASIYDFNKDGFPDLLLGNCKGEVWIYRNAGRNHEFELTHGECLRLANGKSLIAGPFDTSVKPYDFSSMSGNRSVPVAWDADGDGIWDLTVSDATGGITYFHNCGTNDAPVFDEGIIMMKKQGRIFHCVIDWDGDGKKCLIVSSDELELYRQTGYEHGKPVFANAEPLPHVIWYDAQPYGFDFDGDGDTDLVVSDSYGYMWAIDRSWARWGSLKGAIISNIENKC